MLLIILIVVVTSGGGGSSGGYRGYLAQVSSIAADSQQAFDVGGLRNGDYRDAVSGQVAQVTNGHLTFRVAPHSAGVWVLNGPGKIGEDGEFLRGVTP